jgi:hypothetical protein
MQVQPVSFGAGAVLKTDVFDEGLSGAMKERRESGEDEREFEKLLK